jgi:hypothetical protein
MDTHARRPEQREDQEMNSAGESPWGFRHHGFVDFEGHGRYVWSFADLGISRDDGLNLGKGWHALRTGLVWQWGLGDTGKLHQKILTLWRTRKKEFKTQISELSAWDRKRQETNLKILVPQLFQPYSDQLSKQSSRKPCPISLHMSNPMIIRFKAHFIQRAGMTTL